MQTLHKLVVAAALVGLGALGSGCLLAGNYHSAKTLQKGESSFGVTFSATQYEVGDSAVVLPSLVPEFTYHVGMQDNLEIGGRVGLASLALEGDIKYRLVKSDRLHVAIAPSIGVQSLIVINGTIVKLPAILTYEMSDNVAVTGAAFATTTYYSSVDPSDDDDDLGAFSGSLGGAGASFALELSGSVFAIRPGIEFTRYQFAFDGEQFDAFNTVNLMVHLAFIGGREKQQLDRIERKLDAIGPPQ